MQSRDPSTAPKPALVTKLPVGGKKRPGSDQRLPPHRQLAAISSQSGVGGPTKDERSLQAQRGIPRPARANTVSVRPQPGKHARSTSQPSTGNPTSKMDAVPSQSYQRQPSVRGNKPAFSAMQHQFSPRKQTRAAIVEQGESSREATVNADDVKDLQLELTQLHLLHQSAAKVQREWEDSAMKALGNRFDDLRSRDREIREIAHLQKNLLNQLALAEWCQGSTESEMGEKVRQLSQNIMTVDSLLHADGKYTHILRVFESWFTRARQARESRDINRSHPHPDLAMIESIGDGWKAEATVLERELTYSLRELKSIGDARPASSLGRMLSLHQTLLANLLEELDVIQWIENEIMERESTWMEQTIDALSSNVEKDL